MGGALKRQPQSWPIEIYAAITLHNARVDHTHSLRFPNTIVFTIGILGFYEWFNIR